MPKAMYIIKTTEHKYCFHKVKHRLRYDQLNSINH
jgi:hypothetical protein